MESARLTNWQLYCTPPYPSTLSLLFLHAALSGKPLDQCALTQAHVEFNPTIHHNDIAIYSVLSGRGMESNGMSKMQTGFILRRTKIIPFDIVLSDEECWMYPDPKDQTKWLPSASVKYYCIRKSCAVDNFHINASFVQVPPSTKDKLLTSHVKILTKGRAWLLCTLVVSVFWLIWTRVSKLCWALSRILLLFLYYFLVNISQYAYKKMPFSCPMVIKKFSQWKKTLH